MMKDWIKGVVVRWDEWEDGIEVVSVEVTGIALKSGRKVEGGRHSGWLWDFYFGQPDIWLNGKYKKHIGERKCNTEFEMDVGESATLQGVRLTDFCFRR